MMSLPTFHARGNDRLEQLQTFASELKDKALIIGFKPSARGWDYILEQENLVTKDQFDYVERLINDCREKGLLPLDFVAEEEARAFSGVETPDPRSLEEYLYSCLNVPLQAEEGYGLDWWDGEQYYLQMVVEKIDLRTLFKPVCEEYHIPIANTKGWSSLLQRAEYARRFREAEQRGLKCILLYCGDHDPPGLRISEFLRRNLADISSGTWKDGTPGYDPANLIIDRFGLNRDFIDKHRLTWIDNLVTGSGMDLSDPNHYDHDKPYVQDYIREHGKRKCEANALVVIPEASRQLCRDAIEKYLGSDALQRFELKKILVRQQFQELREKTGIGEALRTAMNSLSKVRAGGREAI